MFDIAIGSLVLAKSSQVKCIDVLSAIIVTLVLAYSARTFSHRLYAYPGVYHHVTATSS